MFIHGLSLQYDGQFKLDDEVITKYEESNKLFYQPFLKQQEYILDNYLVSHLFYTGFPFENQQKPLNNYLKLITSFSSIQVILIRMACFHKGIDILHVLQLIQSHEKFTTHNSQYLSSLLRHLKNNKLKTLYAIIPLIKA